MLTSQSRCYGIVAGPIRYYSTRNRERYTSEAFQQLLAELGVTCCMSRLGNVWDNSAMKSFSSLKTERLAGKAYRSRSDEKPHVFDYIEHFYNPMQRVLNVNRTGRSSYESYLVLAC